MATNPTNILSEIAKLSSQFAGIMQNKDVIENLSGRKITDEQYAEFQKQAKDHPELNKAMKDLNKKMKEFKKVSQKMSNGATN